MWPESMISSAELLTQSSPEHRSIDADVLVPELWVFRDEGGHQLDTFEIVDHFDLYSVGAQQALGACEGAILADDHPGDLIEEDGAAAHDAGGEGGVDRRTPVVDGRQTPRVLEGIHLGMENGRPLLHPAVVAAADDFPVDLQSRADGNAASVPSLPGFIDGDFEAERRHSGIISIAA